MVLPVGSDLMLGSVGLLMPPRGPGGTAGFEEGSTHRPRCSSVPGNYFGSNQETRAPKTLGPPHHGRERNAPPAAASPSSTLPFAVADMSTLPMLTSTRKSTKGCSACV